MKKSVFHLIKTVILSSLITFGLLILFVGFIRKALENFSSLDLRSFLLMLFLWIIYSIFFCLFYNKNLEKTYFKHEECFNVIDEIRCYLKSSDGKATLSVYGILAIILELSLLIKISEKNIIATLFSAFFPLASSIHIIIVRSLLSFVLVIFVCIIATVIRSYKIYKFYK